jgi:hypothetical protein
MEILWTGKYIKENFPIHEFQLFDLLRAGVQAFTFTGQNVVDRDPLLRKEYTLEYVEEQEWKIEVLSRGTDSTSKVITGRSCGVYREPRKQLSRIETDKNALRKLEKMHKDKWTDPKGCKSISFTLPDDDIKRIAAILEAKTFRYESEGVKKYMRAHGISPLEPSLPATPQGQPEKPIKISTIPTEKQPEPETTPQKVDVNDYIKGQRDINIQEKIIAWELHNPGGAFRLTHLAVARALGLGNDLNEKQIDALKQRGKRACDKGKVMLAPRKKSKKP